MSKNSAEKIAELERLLEEKSQKLEKANKEINFIQQQLFQHEKMATLGKLSAGIAHEIKNPLNFVNNFSELSIEFIDEIQENLEKLEKNATVKEINASLEDVKSNLHKIQQNGMRVNRIVKSMLLHARGSNGKLEPTDINELIKEYVNLAFHGMRASKDPINVRIELELDDNIGMVPLNPEDFSRVILNMCNNAFDIMREKINDEFKDESKEPYTPKLTVRTKIKTPDILIEIEDNGLGIPEDIKGKLLEPFFTTKKGTAGTGLGLSISHEIIQAHGGRLEIESKISEFTRFRIFIPNHQ